MAEVDKLLIGYLSARQLLLWLQFTRVVWINKNLEMKFSVFCLALCLALVASEKARYDNYRVYEILVEDEQQLELMKHIESFPDGVRSDFPA